MQFLISEKSGNLKWPCSHIPLFIGFFHDFEHISLQQKVDNFICQQVLHAQSKRKIHLSRHILYLVQSNMLLSLSSHSKLYLKELRNCILRIILVWSLFCLMRIYVGLHFLQFLLENYFFVLLCFVLFFLFWIKCSESRHYVFWCYVILLPNFVLTL